MPVNLIVTFDELPEVDRVQRLTGRSQNEGLLDIEKECRGIMASVLPREQQDMVTDSRHFWYNGEFQPHQKRSLIHITSAPTLTLNFRRDSYVVSTPKKAEMDFAIDPEKTVADVLEHLHKEELIASICCYEVLDSQGRVLEENEMLWKQNVLPYYDAKRKAESHLHVRQKAALMRRAYLLLVALGLVGLLAGCGLHWLMVPTK